METIVYVCVAEKRISIQCPLSKKRVQIRGDADHNRHIRRKVHTPRVHFVSGHSVGCLSPRNCFISPRLSPLITLIRSVSSHSFFWSFVVRFFLLQPPENIVFAASLGRWTSFELPEVKTKWLPRLRTLPKRWQPLLQRDYLSFKFSVLPQDKDLSAAHRPSLPCFYFLRGWNPHVLPMGRPEAVHARIVVLRMVPGDVVCHLQLLWTVRPGFNDYASQEGLPRVWDPCQHCRSSNRCLPYPLGLEILG